MTQWDSPARHSFVLKVPLRHLRPSVIYSVPCDWILQRAYCELKTRLGDIVSHLRHLSHLSQDKTKLLFSFFSFYSIMRFKENSLPDS